MVKKETEGRSGKHEGAPAHTREVQLGCVFTQAQTDAEGYPIRDPDSTTYTGAIETAEQFGKRLYREAWKRGWSRAEKKVVMGDGSEWIWNQAQWHFPGATQIVDLYHAREPLWELARQRHPHDEAQQNRWMMIHQDLLDGGKIEERGSGPWRHPMASWPRRCVPRPAISRRTPSACATPSFASRACLWARALSKPDAKR